MLQNPIGTVSYMALFTTMVEHADEMAEAYKAMLRRGYCTGGQATAAHTLDKARVLENDPVIFDAQTTRSSSQWGEGKESKLIGYTVLKVPGAG